MHPDQLTVRPDDVSRLVAAQFPAWAGHDVHPVDSPGTVNALFRLADELVVRLPLQPTDPDTARAVVAHEVDVARRLGAVGLPAATPEPLAVGEPDAGYPMPWSVWRWLPGRTAYDVDVADDPGVAAGLAAFVRALRAVPTAGAAFPGGRRGGDLHDHDGAVTDWLADARGMVDVDGLTRLWRDLRDTPHDPAHDTWTHGDLMPGNLLVAPGALTAVLDLEIAGVADPAVDLAPAWNLFDSRARAVFRDEVDVDDATWQRGRAWSLAQAVGTIAYYRVTNPRMSSTGIRTVAALLAEG